MKVVHLRLVAGCYALKSSNNIMANDHTAIDRLGNGDYMVKVKGAKPVIVSSNQVLFAECEEEYASKVPVSDVKR